jgi:hypothetical protein
LLSREPVVVAKSPDGTRWSHLIRRDFPTSLVRVESRQFATFGPNQAFSLGLSHMARPLAHDLANAA